MTNTLVIYDNEGYIISARAGEPTPREPIGVPFIWIDIPVWKQIKYIDGIGVDVSKAPHQVILEDIPPSEIDVLKKENEELKASQTSQDELIMSLILGGA